METIKKSFKDISWQVPESVYRADPALSYSILSTYEREGRFNSLSHLEDKKSSPSLTFGSIVDCLMTDSEEEFKKRFIVAEFPDIGDQLVLVTQDLFRQFGTPVEKNTEADSFEAKYYPKLEDIPDADISATCVSNNYYANDRYTKFRVKQVREKCGDYYNLLMISQGKQIISITDKADADNCVKALYESKASGDLFRIPTDPMIEAFDQLKFKCIDSGNCKEDQAVIYRSMADRIIINHRDKTVLPIDLKTSSHFEWDFPKSFQQWRYDLQARLYWRNIRQNMDNDPYFKDFELLDYVFVVVNRNSLQPMVWKYEDTKKIGEIRYRTKYDNLCILRDPYTIGRELDFYKNSGRTIPLEVTKEGTNLLMDTLKG